MINIFCTYYIIYLKFFVYPDEKLFNDIRIMTALRASMKPLDIEKAIIQVE